MTWEPKLVIPHHSGPRGDTSLDFPDVSYAWILDQAEGRFAMAYYDGFKGNPCDIRLSVIQQ